MKTMMPGMELVMLTRMWVTVWRKMTGEAVVQLQVLTQSTACRDDWLLSKAADCGCRKCSMPAELQDMVFSAAWHGVAALGRHPADTQSYTEGIV